MSYFSETIAAYQQQLASPVQVAQQALARIRRSTLNCFISVDEADVLRQAQHIETRLGRHEPVGPLAGIPIAIKDLIDVAGARTTMGSRQYEHNVAGADAAVVHRLRQSGAIILGKTNTHQFAYGSTGDRSDSGPVLNPIDPRRITGGSSSGSAAAIASGICHGALGTDTSASIRLPAALCGVVGHKPSRGLLPLDGIFPLSASLDHVGPLSASVLDNAVLMDVLCGAGTRHADLAGAPIRGRRIGVLCGFYADYVDGAVAEALRHARHVLEEAGAHVIDIEVAQTQCIYDAQQTVLRAEAYALHRKALTSGAPFIPEVAQRLVNGASVSAADYLDALNVQPVARAAFDGALDQVDMLLSPTCGITAPLQDERLTNLGGDTYSTFWLLTRLTAPTNFSGHPSLSVPFGEDAAGLPIGMQLIGRLGDDASLYPFARVLEQAGDQAGAATMQ